MYCEVLSVTGYQTLGPYSCLHTTATTLSITKNIAPALIRKIMR